MKLLLGKKNLSHIEEYKILKHISLQPSTLCATDNKLVGRWSSLKLTVLRRSTVSSVVIFGVVFLSFVAVP